MNHYSYKSKQCYHSISLQARYTKDSNNLHIESEIKNMANDIADLLVCLDNF